MLIGRAVAGTSLLALMAASAAAQVTNVGSNRSEVQNNGQDNKASVENGAEGNDRNNSLIVFQGNGNRATVSQVGDDNGAAKRHEGGTNVSTVRQLGFRNSVTLLQAGNGNGSSVDQYLDPRIDTVGDRTAVVEQRGDANSSSIVQVTWNNTATVRQGNSAATGGAISTIFQFSAGNVATVTMNGGSPDAANRSHVEQTRIDPIVTNSTAVVDISGTFNLSYLYQVGSRNVATHSMLGTQNTIIGKSYGDNNTSTVVQQGYRNFATLNQFAGVRNSSRIEQGESETASDVGGDRQVYVMQGGSDNSSTVIQRRTSNNAVVNQSGSGTSSNILQTGLGNFAQVSLLDGAVDAPNSSSITQTPFERSETRSIATVSIRGLGNDSTVNQVGLRQFASVEIAGGGRGITESNQRRGNSVGIKQDPSLTYPSTGRGGEDAGHTARVQIGLVQGGGVGTVTSIEQLGRHANIGNEAVVRQDGQFDSVGISQSTRFSGVDGGAIANVSARGISNSVSLIQYGRELAVVTQGFGRDSRFSAFQVDSAGTRFPEAFYAGGRGNNSIVAAQYGDRNRVGIHQEGADNRVTVWQKTGSSDNNILVDQGSLVRTPQDVEGFVCFPRCQFAFNAAAAATQAGRFNSASVVQYSAGRATIEQNGTGSEILQNLARIVQFGGTPEAWILQGPDVAPSVAGDPSSGAPGDPNYFQGGARPSEARIRQSDGLSARVEQRGRGQYALIDQSGANTASILQDVGATNATAIIAQSGSGNSYSVIQTMPGQYINVSQTGTNNSATNVISRP